MAFINNEGKSISYDCTDLIDELEQDIAEFGGDRIMDVITEQKHGVTLYKDYWIHDPDLSMPTPALKDTESIITMTATALMEVYKIENEII